ncbi:ImmA/IrrE family metallo-endopeptidase [Streptococcus dysgalactiae subsp. equisimilis]|uniref:ImmA/IrrE family metallo-endopeptidase n=1 Tax=Streptococcus dysgalactiae TaxID=1334 RepID=UPI003FD8CFE7
MHHNYTGEKLEKKAETILGKYKNGLYLEKIEPIDVDEFAEFFVGASIDFANLSDDKKTLGLTCFYDGVIEVWNEDRTEKIKILSNANTIFLDTDTDLMCIKERTRFTIMHECSHILLHKRFYFVGTNQRNKKITYKPFYHETWNKNPFRTEVDIHEWQANRLAAALLVPRKTLFNYIEEELKIEQPYKINISDQLINKLSSMYDVSIEMMKRRLRDLDIIEDYFGG